MKTIISFLLLALLASAVFSQIPYDYANGWITPAMTGIAKIKVDETGVYRLTTADLTAAGVSLAGIAPDDLHLYRRGMEIPMRVEESAGSVTALEFFGKPNDGAEEALMYRDQTTSGGVNPALHFNPSRSIFTDEASCFLVSDNSFPGMRMVEFVDLSYGSYTPQPFVRTGVHEDYLGVSYLTGPGTSIYDVNYTLNPDFVVGEGYEGRYFDIGAPLTQSIATPGADPAGGAADLSLRVFARRPLNHQLQISINGSLGLDTTFYNFSIQDFSLISIPVLTSTTDLLLDALSVSGSTSDGYYLNAVTIEYDHSNDLAGASSFPIVKYDKPFASYLELTSVDATSSGWVWDMQYNRRCAGTYSGGNLQVILPGGATARDLWVVTDKALLTPVSVAPWSKPGLSDISNAADMLVLTSDELASSASAYSSYRSSSSPRPQDTQVVDYEAIYDEFGYGDINPLAVKRFLHYASLNWSSPPDYVFIWGKGTYQTRGTTENIAPTYGYPGCDREFVSDFYTDVRDYNNWAAIGRLSVKTDAEGLVYLNKVMEYENGACSPPYTGVFLGGGADTSTTMVISTFMQQYADSFTASPFVPTSYLYQNIVAGGVATTAPFSSDSAISRGATLIEILSQGNGETYDVDFGEPDDHTNTSKYPFIVDLGCGGAEFYNSTYRKSERWINSPDRGCIVFIGFASPAVYLSPTTAYGTELNQNLFRELMNHPIGEVMQRTDSSVAGSSIFSRTVTLLGDPALVMCNPLIAGVEGPAPATSLVIWPNPANDAINVRLEMPLATQVEVKLVSLQGVVLLRDLHAYQGGPGEISMNLGGIASGLYVIEVSSNGELLAKGKVSVQH